MQGLRILHFDVPAKPHPGVRGLSRMCSSERFGSCNTCLTGRADGRERSRKLMETSDVIESTSIFTSSAHPPDSDHSDDDAESICTR